MDLIVTPPAPAVAFGTVELSPALASTSQTVSPDGKVLSLIFTGLSAEAQEDGLRGAVAGGSLVIPLTGVTSSVFVKVTLRGTAVVAGPNASGRFDIRLNGFGLGSGFAEDAEIQQDLDLQLVPDFPVVVLNLLLSCQVFGTGATTSALVTLDTVDLEIQ
jgi:hypothetical protein